MSEQVDWDKAIKKINLDLPRWAVRDLDREADRRGITRQSLIKGWVIDRLDALRESPVSNHNKSSHKKSRTG